MKEKKTVVSKKVKIVMFLRKLYEERYLDNDTYVQALKLAKGVKED